MAKIIEVSHQDLYDMEVILQGNIERTDEGYRIKEHPQIVFKAKRCWDYKPEEMSEEDRKWLKRMCEKTLKDL